MAKDSALKPPWAGYFAFIVDSISMIVEDTGTMVNEFDSKNDASNECENE